MVCWESHRPCEWVSMNDEQMVSVRPFRLDKRFFKAEGQKENAPSCQTSSYCCWCWVQRHKWCHTVIIRLIPLLPKTWLDLRKILWTRLPVVHVKCCSSINKGSVLHFALPVVSQKTPEPWANMCSESEQWCFHFAIFQGLILGRRGGKQAAWQLH